MKCLFTYDYGKENMDKIRELGYEVILRREEEVVYSEDLKDVEVLLCYNPFDTLDISRMENLKLIQLSSVGIDQIPKNIVKEKEIILCNNRGGYSIPMGEWIVLKILELYKNSYEFYKNQLDKKWKMDTSLLELYGSTVGFVGTGTIAKEAAKRLQGFDVEVLGMNTEGRKEEYFDKCFSRDELEKMLPLCDVVVVAVPATKETYKLIDKKMIELMKNGVFLINIARGNILDEEEVIAALKNGKIKKASLDVFENEPLPQDSPLWNLENVVITCHNSWISDKRNQRRFDMIYDNLRRHISKEKVKNAVNIDRGY